ncbi:MAG: hypothetical protein AAB214_00720 [Fibrobacterota bacterium]
MRSSTRHFLSLAALALSGCATVAPDSVPWMLHRREVENAPWWGKPRFNMETSALLSPGDRQGGVLTPTAQGTIGVPIGSHLGIDAGFGFAPVDFKLAVPVSFDKFVIYPFCAFAMRDSTLLPYRRWKVDPGMEIGLLVDPNLALRLTAGSMRSSPFDLFGKSSIDPYDFQSKYVALTVEPIAHDRQGDILGQFTFGIGNGPRTGTSFFLRLGVNLATTPALFR